MSALVSSRWSTYPITEAILNGITEEELYRAAGLKNLSIQPFQTKLPVETLDRLLSVLPDLIGKPHVYIEMAENPGLDRMEPLDSLIFYVKDSESAIGYVERFGCLVHPYLNVRLLKEKNIAGIRFVPQTENAQKPLYTEIFLGSMLTFAKRLTGVDIKPIQAAFQFARPAYAEYYQRFFRCPIRFDAEHTALTFSWDDMKRPFLGANAFLESRSVREIAQIHDQLPGPSIAAQVSRMLMDRPDTNALKLETVASYLNTSARSLQRTLGSCGTSFKQLKEEILSLKATRLLIETDSSIQCISDDLGFSELSAFYRAFKRWMDMTPMEYRVRYASK